MEKELERSKGAEDWPPAPSPVLALAFSLLARSEGGLLRGSELTTIATVEGLPLALRRACGWRWEVGVEATQGVEDGGGEEKEEEDSSGTARVAEVAVVEVFTSFFLAERWCWGMLGVRSGDFAGTEDERIFVMYWSCAGEEGGEASGQWVDGSAEMKEGEGDMVVGEASGAHTTPAQQDRQRRGR